MLDWDVKDFRILNIQSSTDRFPCRKFSVNSEMINELFTKVDEDSIHLMDKVLKCFNMYNIYGDSKFNRYQSNMKKDVYYLPTLLGLNDSICECHQKYLGVYDMSKVHSIMLSVLVGESPSAVETRLKEYLDGKGISMTQYLNYIINGVKSDIFKKGFKVFDMLNHISNSYLNLKRLADMNQISVEELIRSFIVKYNEDLFDSFMKQIESDNKGVLVQSIGLDTLLLSGPNIDALKSLEFKVYKNSYTVKPEIFETKEFNSEVYKYYLKRGELQVC